MQDTTHLMALEIAKIACNIETDGAAFYKQAAAATTDPAARAVLETLAGDENRHLKTFRDIYRRLDEKMGGDDATTGYLFEDEVTGYLKAITNGLIFPAGTDAQAWFEGHPDLQDIVQYALGVEKSSILFYTEIRSHNAFAYSKELLQDIIREEKKHVVKLNALLKHQRQG